MSHRHRFIEYTEGEMIVRRYTLALVCFAATLALFLVSPISAQSSPAPATQKVPAVSATPTSPTGPQEAYSLPPDKLAKAIALNHTISILTIAGSIWKLVFLCLMLVMLGWAGLERWAQRISSRRWVQGAVFFAAYLIISALAALPVSWLVQHYSLAYGISVQRWESWFAELAKTLVVTLVIGVPLLLLFNWIVRRWPRRYWLAAWVVTLPIMVMVVFIGPLFSPIFDKFEPLQKNYPELVTQLEKVVARTGTNIPPERMFLMKASAKTNGLNAYVNGIGATKRIVVWDTTAGRVPNDEIMFIFGHESGHYVLNHVYKYLAIYTASLFFVYWACAGFAAWMLKRYGDRWGANGLASRTGFMVLLFAVSIVSFLLQPAGNAVGRHFEHQADVYGQEAIHGLVPNPQTTVVATWADVGKAWLEDPHPSPFIEFWLYNHPSVEKRANFGAHYDPWKDGGHGEFFKN